MIVFDGRPEPLSVGVLEAINEGNEIERRWREGSLQDEELSHFIADQQCRAAEYLELPSDDCLIFCSSGVEAINCAIKGLAWGSDGGKIAIVNGDPEGFGESAAWCGRFGFERVAIPLTDGGAVDMDAADRSLSGRVAVGGFSTVTPELFTPRESRSFAELIRSRAGTVAMDVTIELLVRSSAHAARFADVVTLDGVRLGGPIGSGLIWLKPGASWSPLISGGITQSGRRAGALGLGSVYGLTCALKELVDSRSRQLLHFETLHTAAIESIAEYIPNAILPWGAASLPLGLTFIMPGIEGEAVVELAKLEGVVVSTGSPCSRTAGKPSAILTGIGFTPREAASAIHLDFRNEQMVEDIRAGVGAVSRIVKKLREMT